MRVCMWVPLCDCVATQEYVGVGAFYWDPTRFFLHKTSSVQVAIHYITSPFFWKNLKEKFEIGLFSVLSF